MIEIELPDGTIVEFPEGTSEDVMREALSRQFGAPQEEPSFLERAADTVGGMASSLGRGVVRGAAQLADTPGAIFNAGNNLVASGLEKAGVNEDFVWGLRNANQGTVMSGDLASNTVSNLTNGAIDDPGDTRAERIAGRVGEFLPGTVAAGAPKLAYAVAPAIAGEFAAEAAEGRTIPEWVPFLGGSDAEPVARAGAEILAPAGAQMGGLALKRAITPNPADPVRTAAAKRLKQEGVNTTAGQRTGNQNLMYREDAAQRTQAIVGQQDEQFTAAVLKRIGVDAKRATPDVMDEAKTRIGGMFNDLAKRNSIDVDQPLIDASVKAKLTYEKLTNKNNIAPLIENAVDDIAQAARSGQPISGAKYQSLRTDLVNASTGADGALRSAAYSVRQALDEAMGRTLVAKKNTPDIKMYAQARQQWKDYLVVQNAVARAGEDTALGIINPRQIRSAAAQQSKSSYVTGQNDLGNLARDGNAVMPRLPQSGTQPRLDARTISALQAAGTGPTAGGLVYALTRDPGIAAAAAAAGMAAPVARNAMSASRPGQAYLQNQLLSSLPDPTPSPGGLLNILAQQ